ncbi:MAG: hypothetical protein EXS14_09390 [Planctomycetes bacterium]|nr:hypothetical protein [Planctomycetota bacterium]
MEETTTPSEPVAAKRPSRRTLLLVGAGACIAVLVAVVAGIPFASEPDEPTESVAHAAQPAVFPPVLVAEASKEAGPAEAKAPGHGTEPSAAEAQSAAAEPAAVTDYAARFAAALQLESRGQGDDAARRLRALLGSVPAEASSVRRIVLLSLAAIERRLGRDSVSDAVLAEAEREDAPLNGAEILAFARECLAANAPDVARRVLARFSLAASECADGDLARLISVCRLQALACEAEWRRTATVARLPEPAITFLGGGK